AGVRDATEANIFFYHSDHLGSSSFLTDGGGIATQHLQYMPFGEDLVHQQNTAAYYTPYTFSGKERDIETGLSYFGARYYDAGLSIWLSVDPMTHKLPSWSPYNYTLNNPIGLIDPDGRFPWGVVLGGAAEIAIQIASNAATGQKWNRIDWVDVGIAAVAGGATGGFSCVAKLGKLGKLISAASGVTAGAVLDVKTGGEGSVDVTIEALGSRMVFPDGKVIEICGQVMEINAKKTSDVGIELMAGGIGDIAKKVLGAALNKDIAKKADDITRQLRNSATGSKGHAKRVDQLNQLNSDMAGNQVTIDKITDLSKSLSLEDVKQLNE
ncbi:MAG: RHS repeat-associated core domain-containing protein, partial [Sphingobacteriaceae bacterium]|nr:RHS repeat-associated core domain-containing protein [Sphingobacteriaceae bacterium]